jgi:GR25 family glycosyltransferase involved in LPS biosynthesis
MCVVEKAFVISLRERPKRLENFYATLPKLDWLPEVETWWGVNGDLCPPPDNWQAGGGAWGCYRSHMQIMEHCLNNRIASYLVFEDDSQFSTNFAESKLFFDNLPETWHQVYLGGQLMHAKSHRPIQINEHVLRPYNINRTHCFAVSRPGMTDLYRHCSRLPFEHTYHIDHHLGRFHEDARNEIYCPNKWYVGQHGFRSDISGKEEPAQFFPDPYKYTIKNIIPQYCVLYRANPIFCNECTSFLHFGNNLGAGGFDVSLDMAAKMIKPARTLNYWWGFVSREAFESSRTPALRHPELSDEILINCLPNVQWIRIESAESVEDIRNQVTAELEKHKQYTVFE